MKEKDKIAYLFEEAVNSFNAGDYRSAIAAWQEILKYDPGNQQAQLGIRVAEERIGSAGAVGVVVTEGEEPSPPAGASGGFFGDESSSSGGSDLAGWGMAEPASPREDGDSTLIVGSPLLRPTAPPAESEADRTILSPPSPGGGGILDDLDLPGDPAAFPEPAASRPTGRSAGTPSPDATIVSPPSRGAGSPFGGDEIGPLEDLEDLDLPGAPAPGAPAAPRPSQAFGRGQSEFDMQEGEAIPFQAPAPPPPGPADAAFDEIDLPEPPADVSLPPPPPPPSRLERTRPDAAADEDFSADAIQPVPLREPRRAPRAEAAAPARAGLDPAVILKIAIPAVAAIVLLVGGYFGVKAVLAMLNKGDGETAPSGPTGVPVTAVELLAAATDDLDAGRYDEAEKKVARVLQMDPGNSKAKELHETIATEKARPPEYNRGMKDVREFFCRDEDWERALLKLTELESKYERFRPELQPWIVDGYTNWGIDYLQKRQPREAAELAFAEAGRRAPDDAAIRSLRAFAESWIDRNPARFEYQNAVDKLSFRKGLCR